MSWVAVHGNMYSSMDTLISIYEHSIFSTETRSRPQNSGYIYSCWSFLLIVNSFFLLCVIPEEAGWFPQFQRLYCLPCKRLRSPAFARNGWLAAAHGWVWCEIFEASILQKGEWIEPHEFIGGQNVPGALHDEVKWLWSSQKTYKVAVDPPHHLNLGWSSAKCLTTFHHLLRLVLATMRYHRRGGQACTTLYKACFRNT